MRYHSPSATAGPKSAQSRMIARGADVVERPGLRDLDEVDQHVEADQHRGRHRGGGADARGRRRTAEPELPPAHSGQRKPTAAEVMQSVQIGRSQLEHEMRVSRPGWR